MWDFTCLSLEMSIQLFFFIFLFSGYFCSLDVWVVPIISSGCNQSSPSFFFMSSSSFCISSSMLSSLLLFLSHTFCLYHLLGVRPYTSLQVFCWSSSLVHFKSDLKYLTTGTAHVFIPLMRFLLCCLVSRIFFVLLRNSFFYFFIHHRLFNGVRFQYPQVFVSFLFSDRSDLVSIW